MSLSLSHLRFHSFLFMFVASLPIAMIRANGAGPEPTVELPKIADEPKLIDPATVMPAKLAASATVDLSDSSLGELVDWLREEPKLVVLVEQNVLSEAGVLLGDPISDRLDNAPIYLLLNRLRSLKLAWFYEDDILHITSVGVTEERLTTIPYNLGDLLDAGYDSGQLVDVIESAIEPTTWDSVGGSGGLNFLGDVMFVRQNDEVHRKVQGLFAALRKHGRQTFALDPPQHLILRQTLEENVSVDFEDTPLDSAVKELAAQLKIDVRLDLPALRAIRIRERQPITLKLSDRKLKTVLQAMVVDFELTWILRDGVLWITSLKSAEEFFKTAVYDVRDLCRDGSESDALGEAIMSQTPSVWSDVGGAATIEFAKPGVLVISGQESLLMEVLTLLETYRTALRASKQRDRHAVDPNEVITVYYRLHANVAADLSAILPALVQPDSWESAAKPEGKGEIIQVASPPDLFSAEGQLVTKSSNADAASAQAMVVARAVLIIRQTRAAHDEIVKVIQRVETGDLSGLKGMGGGLGGGGSFGGGFFSVPPRRASKNQR